MIKTQCKVFVHAMEEYEVEVHCSSFETSGDLSPSGSSRFIPDKEPAGAQRKGGRLGLIAGANTGNAKHLLALQRIEPTLLCCPIRGLVTIAYCGSKS